MKTNLKLFSITLLAMGGLPLFAERDFVFGENPNAPRVRLQKIGVETPYRLLSAKDPNGFNFEMDDGTIWRVSGSDGVRAVHDWRINDPLVIYPCVFPSWTGTRYYVENERTKTTANVEISFGPIAGSSTHNRIADINFVHGQILVADGAGRTSQWLVSRSDLRKLQHWKLNQTIILGFMENSYSRWFSHESYILINFERNEFIEANLL